MARRKKLQMSPKGWQAARRSRKFGDFNLRAEPVLDQGDKIDLSHTPIRPVPKRPWHCPHCPVRLAYQHTLNEHLLRQHAALLPHGTPYSQSGAFTCRHCPCSYKTCEERAMHVQAHHPRVLQEPCT